MEEKMILVCKTNGEKCNELGFEATVGKMKHIFCCEKGFNQSLVDFSKKGVL